MANTSLLQLRKLANLISESVTKIEDAYLEASAPFPTLDDTYDPKNSAEELFVSSPGIKANSDLILAASAQLTALLQTPPRALLNASLGYYIPVCLRVASSFHIAEILRDGPKTSKEIGALAKTDQAKLARVLRLLASHHIFKEVSPDVFGNNRLSSALDKGKSLEQLMDSSQDKFSSAPGVVAWLETNTDEGMKSASYLTENLQDPTTAFSQDPDLSPLPRAFNLPSPKGLFSWFEQPDNEARLRRFGHAMTGTAILDPSKIILKGYQWDTLPPDSVVVDVGSGVGSKAIMIAGEQPHLSIVLQDRAPVIEQAKEYWAINMPNAKVQFQAHDFFAPQPVQNASIFLLISILHDWPDEEAIKILKHLRTSAMSLTCLIIRERIIPYACYWEGSDSESERVRKIPNAIQLPAPEPLLPNYGSANGLFYYSDLHMMCLLNAPERTIGQFVDLCEKGGWAIMDVVPASGAGSYSIMKAVPI